MHPIGTPARSLNVAMDFFARVTRGFCPVMAAMSFTAASTIFISFTASPRPMLTVILSSFGTCMTFLYLNSFIIAGTVSFKYWTLILDSLF